MTDIDELDYERDVQIDRHDLEGEWLRLPTLIMLYSEAAAEAKEDLLKADEKVKTVRSQLLLQVAKTPEILGSGVKPTESNKEAYYRDHVLYKEAKEDHINAQFEFDTINGAVFAIQAKKTALEGMVKLFGMGYFSDMDDGIDSEIRENRKQKRQNKPKKTRST